MKSITLAVSLVAILGAAPAFAADVPLKAPAAVVASSWTGFYVGGSLGARWDSDRWTTPSIQAAPIGPNPGDTGNNPTTFKSAEFRYGVYGGYNLQISPMLVLGIEGDFAWTTKSDRQRINGIPGVFGPTFGPATSDLAGIDDTWDASIRGRLGVLVTPSTLLYGTGGLSWLRSEAIVECSLNALTSWCSGSNSSSHRTDSAAQTLFGWTAGIGLEQMFAMNWLLRAEYRYSSYEIGSVTLLQGGAVFANADLVNADIKIHTQTLLAGVAYRFGGPDGSR